MTAIPRLSPWILAPLLLASACDNSTNTFPPQRASNEEPQPNPGFVVLSSVHSVADTASRLEGLIKNKGLTLFTKIDHAANASAAGLSLPETRVIIFGNPNAGTPLMAASRTIAIDLPQKILIWKSGDNVQLAYNSPSYLASRHQVNGQDERLKKIAGLLSSLAKEATSE